MPNHPEPTISIIIPALNEEDNIGRCLQSIAEMDTASHRCEVILVDNGSTDNTRGIAESYSGRLDLRVLLAPGVNISALRNTGERHARGSLLAFVDADCTVSKEWMTHAVPYFRDPDVGAAGCSHEIPADSSWVAIVWDLNTGRKRVSRETTTLPSGNLIVHKCAFESVGGFDEQLKTNEDFDLCHRLRLRGFKIYSDPRISAVHWGVPRNLAEFYRRQKWHGTHVFKAFLSNFADLVNVRAVAYAFYYFLGVAFLLISLPVSLVSRNALFLLLAAAILVVPPFVLSARTIAGRHASVRQLVPLSLLYLIYGVARARSLLSLNR